MIYQCAGIVGVNPGPFTFWELTQMAEGRRKDEWERLSFLRADVKNLWTDNPVSPAQLNPYTAERAKALTPKLTDPRDVALMWGIPDGR